MNIVTVTDPTTKRSYFLEKQVYETESVWCGTGCDPEFGDIFVKLLRYDPHSGNAREIRSVAHQEALTMERAARCTTGIPRLYAHWDDKSIKAYVLVMQKLPGITLRKWLENQKRVRSDEKTIWLHCLILRQIAQILLEIHNKIPGISHRDLKPENVMIWRNKDNHWQVGIIDFGTAALDYSVRVGTYGYQSPEQRTRSRTIMGSGEAKDVFSLGIMWYEMLTGIPAESVYEEFCKNYEDPSSGWAFRPSLPPEILDTADGKRHNRMFEKMTDFDPEQRPSLRDVVNGIQIRRKQR